MLPIPVRPARRKRGKAANPMSIARSHTAQMVQIRTAPASRGALVMGSLLVSILLWFGCTHPNRPATVVSAAKWVPSAKTGVWQACSVSESEGNEVSCTVWNEKGTVLISERYLPLDGRTIPFSDQLSIADGPCKGPYEVCLVNGRVLAPASIFEREKALFQRSHNGVYRQRTRQRNRAGLV